MTVQKDHRNRHTVKAVCYFFMIVGIWLLANTCQVLLNSKIIHAD